MHAGHTVACPAPVSDMGHIEKVMSTTSHKNIRFEQKIRILVCTMQYNKSAFVYDTNEDNG